MIYFFLILLAISIAFIFRNITRQYHNWPEIKERWFRAGIDNRMLFSSVKLENNQEVARLDGEYNNCAVAVSMSTGKEPRAIIEVRFPPALNTRLTAYNETVFERMNELLTRDLELEDQFNRTITVYEDKVGVRQKRLNPRLIEQLFELHKEVAIGRFEINAESFKYEQAKLLLDPLPLFPILDGMVMLVILIDEQAEHLLVQ